jgi:hypothetical protein
MEDGGERARGPPALPVSGDRHRTSKAVPRPTFRPFLRGSEYPHFIRPEASPSRPFVIDPFEVVPPLRVAPGRAPSRTRRRGGILLVCAIVLLLGASGWVGNGTGVGRSTAPTAIPSVPVASGVSPAAPRGSSAIAPAIANSNTPCYSLNATICVSVQNTSIPNIIPAPGNHAASIEPSSNSTIALWLRSEFTLLWPGNVSTSGPHSPLSLNATGVLWNGAPYYSPADGSEWHTPGNTWWSLGPAGVNKTYPYYYGLSFPAKTANGTPEFFPGMTLTWWIYFVSNVSGVYSHWSSTNFTFTFGGAWPASPYPGSAQYGGASAPSEDLVVTQAPAAPNFNDSVNLTVATTGLDDVSNASIGGGYVNVVESAPDGTVLAAPTFPLDVSVHQSQGATGINVTLPASLARFPGALVQYTVSAWDTSQWNLGQVGPDLVTTATQSYTVNGNGSFATGVFADDLAILTTPIGPSLGGAAASVPAGMPVAVDLASRVPTTAIEAAEVQLTLTYASVNETVLTTIPLHRANSTHFLGTIPPLPLGTQASYRVVAWDFAQSREVSNAYLYDTPTLSQLLPSVPSNSTFFVVYVYDAGNGGWVSGANVTVTGVASSGYVRTSALTFAGVAYPNATGRPFVPLLLTAGVSYRVTVSDPTFLPGGATTAPVVSVELTVPHSPTGSGVLEDGANWVVGEAGASLYFWLNQTYAGVTYAAPVGITAGPTVLAGVGLGAAALVVLPLLAWWGRIRAKRTEQEKRITL